MFTVTGKLSGKSVVKSGQSEKGTWRIIQFLIKKTRNKKMETIPFTAKGKLADKIDDIILGEKISVRFFIEGNKYGDKYFTNCIAVEVEKYVKKDKYKYGSVSFGNELYYDQTENLIKDNNLFNQKTQ